MPVIGWKLTCGAELCIQEARKSSTDTTSNSAGVLGHVQDSVPESYKERASRMATRLKIVAAGKPAGTALHTAALIYHESGSGSQTEEKIRLAVVTRCSNAKGVNTQIGNIIKLYGVSEFAP
ncbi:hypothetical protein GGX14DRAFT_397033 [Mycena pura]|uniref:Uncharacterized protein n=1 Tax=Mycena pura TaxID=153505 RepID=A0AAD6VBR6_9AGAR|nr:hypothetical protein GGX14DRAFT_397033 [Mycena pura]